MKIFKLFAIALLTCVMVFPYVCEAVPAYPGLIKVRQPDGSSLEILLHGDEYFGYATTSDGYNITAGDDGYYYYGILQPDGVLTPSSVRAKDARYRSSEDSEVLSRVMQGIPAQIASNRSRMARTNSSEDISDEADVYTKARAEAEAKSTSIKSLVILVNFKDCAFQSYGSQTPREVFSEMLNKKGYSANSATGSAKDYYMENSNGRFEPEFDVVGPYTLPKNMAAYGAPQGDRHDVDPWQMAIDAAKAADPYVDFSAYATDGVIRDIFIFYAGYNQAEGGHPNTIWPHRSFVSATLDGVRLSGYACSSELMGNENYGPTMAGIGTFCHEFGHVVGWPDYYDTDGVANGNARTPQYYSLMCSGSYNNNGRTPPALTAMERYSAGWLIPEEFESSGIYQLKPVTEDHAFIIKTDNPDEYFLLENRNQSVNIWEQMLGVRTGDPAMHGLLVYHVDSSLNVIPGASVSARQLWQTNSINCYSAHPCFRVVEAVYSANGLSLWLFPGGGNVTEMSSSSMQGRYNEWSGMNVGTALFGITTEGDNIKFRVDNGVNENSQIIKAYIGENDAFLEWPSSAHTGNFHVEVRSSGSSFLDTEVENKSVYISGLSPGMRYTVRISEVGDIGMDQAVITTGSSLVNDAYIAEIQGSYMSSEAIPLRIKGTPNGLTSVKWSINGNEVLPPYAKLSPGRYEIKADILTSTRGREVISKIVNVQ